MTHREAIAAMVGATLMWSIAGVVTRHLDAARSFEVTFWRSLFNAVALALVLGLRRGPAALWHSVRNGGRALWVSALCWGVMYTAFMVALTLTTVAHVLITMAVGPLLTALLSRAVLAHRLAFHTWLAIAAAGAGIAWMYAGDLHGLGTHSLLGTAVAFCVPLAAAANWTAMQYERAAPARQRDLMPAVLMGALLSALVTAPLAMPLRASMHDLGLLALLGLVQLALPCLLVVAVARVLSAAEVALLGLLEVIFGVLWAWLGAGETPSAIVLQGGAVVLVALAANAWNGARTELQ